MKQKKALDYGIHIGKVCCGQLNKISDVEGVTVGHSTVTENGHNTGVTVIMPSRRNIYTNKLIAASYVQNGFGKTAGTIQIDELGTLETPIALTNTLNVGIVSDALVQYMLDSCSAEGISLRTVNPVVCECNDSALNNIAERTVGAVQVYDAIKTASRSFREGDVGAGRGTVCYGLKGGIGSASRVIELDGKPYTIGILVQSNYGATADLMINGRNIGQDIMAAMMGEECDRGSIIVVLACDIPLTSRQLRRVLKRCSVGIARMGSFIGHGSGEVFIGFSTANVIAADEKRDLITMTAINEGKINMLFRAAGEATEEAILNSMLCADEVTSPDGRTVKSLRSYINLYQQGACK